MPEDQIMQKQVNFSHQNNIFNNLGSIIQLQIKRFHNQNNLFRQHDVSRKRWCSFRLTRLFKSFRVELAVVAFRPERSASFVAGSISKAIDPSNTRGSEIVDHSFMQA